MLTDSSAEASALGSGPRGRRFKSALSERGHRLCWCTTQSRKEACFAPENDVFSGVFSWCLYNLSRKTVEIYVSLYNSIAEIPFVQNCSPSDWTPALQDLQNDRDIRLFIWPVRCILNKTFRNHWMSRWKLPESRLKLSPSCRKPSYRLHIPLYLDSRSWLSEVRIWKFQLELRNQF